MTWREAFRYRSPLARRLIIWTVLFSSVITLLLTLLQLYRDYRVDVSAIETHLREIESVHLPTLAGSLWATDQSRLQLQLEGILELRDMHFVELREGDFVWASAGRLESTNVIRREVPVTYTHDGRRQVLGTLTVVATLDGVYARLFDKAVTILLSNAIKTFLVALFMLMLFHWLVTRHLRRIGDWLARQEGDTPPLTLDKTTSKPGGDEIDALADTLNKFRDGQAQALKAISIEHKRYESLFDNANDGIFLAEVGSWRILDANRRASEHTGYTRDELLSMTLIQLGPPESARETETALRRLNKNGSSVYERVYRRKDGSLFPAEVSGRVVQLGDVRVIESFVRDLTERYRSGQVLREREELLRLFVEHSPAAIGMFDNEMRYVVASRRWMTDYGLGDRHIIGCSHYEIFPEIPQCWKDIHQRCLAGATERCDEDPFVRADGHTDWVRWEIRPWRKVDGRIGGIIIFSELVTGRKQAEAEREKLLIELTTRNMEMENFVYTISHDLKAPLITIGGFATMLAGDLDRNNKEQGRESIMEIQKAVRGMQDLIEDLLLLSRTGQIPGEPEDVDLQALLGDVQARCASHIERERATIRVVLPLPRLHVDRTRFGQVLQNLLDNGVKFHREGVDPVLEIGAERTNGEARLYVRDNGIGIEKRYQEKIFGLFQRLDSGREGTGVGLTIARRIVEQHGGRLWVESEPGRGSTFWLSIPDSVIVDDGAGASARDIRSLR